MNLEFIGLQGNMNISRALVDLKNVIFGSVTFNVYDTGDKSQPSPKLIIITGKGFLPKLFYVSNSNTCIIPLVLKELLKCLKLALCLLS